MAPVVRAYCDYNATAPVRPAARAAALEALDAVGNPSSIHSAGRAARAQMETAREAVARIVGARPQDVIFTSGATEALHRALDAAADAFDDLVFSAVEHDALWEAARPDYVVPCNVHGVIDLAALDGVLAKAHRPLLALMLANNETGAVQPVAEAARRIREAGGLLLVDASQALGRLDIDLAALDATYLVVSSHKAGGPAGAGALVLAPGAPFGVVRGGGGQERGRRPGTENVPAIAGFGAALRSDFGTERARVAALREMFEDGLRSMHPDVTVFSVGASRLPNTSHFALPHLPAESALIALDLHGVAMSSGAACSSGKVKASRVLAAMGVTPDLSRCALRASFGWASTEADVALALDALAVVRSRLAAGAA